ncbi:MAG: C4-type zinc ribbon domain-containing protein [Verrucomicrobiota bacterium]
MLILQDRDVRCMALEREIKGIPRQIESIKSRFEGQKKKLEDLKVASRQVESERKDLDNQVKSKESQIAKYASQQLGTKKNEEYQALGHEIENCKKEISQLEDRELELMEAYDQSQLEVKAEEAEVAKIAAGIDDQVKALEKKEENHKAEVVKLREEISKLESGIEPSTLSRYRRILKSKGDKAIVPLVNGKICAGCHMELTHQSVVDAKGGQKIASCEHCGRMVYWPGE